MKEGKEPSMEKEIDRVGKGLIGMTWYGWVGYAKSGEGMKGGREDLTERGSKGRVRMGPMEVA